MITHSTLDDFERLDSKAQRTQLETREREEGWLNWTLMNTRCLLVHPTRQAVPWASFLVFDWLLIQKMRQKVLWLVDMFSHLSQKVTQSMHAFGARSAIVCATDIQKMQQKSPWLVSFCCFVGNNNCCWRTQNCFILCSTCFRTSTKSYTKYASSRGAERDCFATKHVLYNYIRSPSLFCRVFRRRFWY